MTTMGLFTIGHGYESREDFVTRLRDHGVIELADVRSFPGSRRSPQFGKEWMAQWLEEARVGYGHWPDLGGRRKPPKEKIPTDGWWKVESFANYAGYTRTGEFREAFELLLHAAEDHDVAIMCGEPCWWRCHRRMIADLAVRAGLLVQHIMPNGALSPHEMSDWLKQNEEVST